MPECSVVSCYMLVAEIFMQCIAFEPNFESVKSRMHLIEIQLCEASLFKASLHWPTEMCLNLNLIHDLISNWACTPSQAVGEIHVFAPGFRAVVRNLFILFVCWFQTSVYSLFLYFFCCFILFLYFMIY